MPLYSNGPQFTGVIPAKDQNAPNPPHNTEDNLQKPDFLREYEEELIAVRRELSALWAEQYDVKYGSKSSNIPIQPYGAQKDMTISGLEREAEYGMRRNKLEEREGELIGLINTYKYVASLGDAPAEEDEPGEPTNAAASGAMSRVGDR